MLLTPAVPTVAAWRNFTRYDLETAGGLAGRSGLHSRRACRHPAGTGQSTAAADLQGMGGRSAIAADADLAIRQNRHVGVEAAAVIIDHIKRIVIIGARCREQPSLLRTAA